VRACVLQRCVPCLQPPSPLLLLLLALSEVTTGQMLPKTLLIPLTAAAAAIETSPGVVARLQNRGSLYTAVCVWQDSS